MGARPSNWPQGFRGKGHTCALFWVLMAGWLGTEAGRRQAGVGRRWPTDLPVRTAHFAQQEEGARGWSVLPPPHSPKWALSGYSE